MVVAVLYLGNDGADVRRRLGNVADVLAAAAKADVNGDDEIAAPIGGQFVAVLK